MLWMMGYDLAGQMLWQRLARGPGLGRSHNRLYAHFSGGLRGLQLFQVKFELLKLDGYLLALRAEHHAAQLLDDHLQMFDLLNVRMQFFVLCGERLLIGGICFALLHVLLNDQRLQGFAIKLTKVRQSSSNHAKSMAQK